MPIGIYERTRYHKRILSEARTRYLSSLTEEENLQLTEMFRKAGQKGHSHSRPIEASQKQSKSLKRWWIKKDKKERPEYLKSWIKAGIKASQHANPSSIEKMIWRELDELKIEYEIQVSFNKFIVDIYIPNEKLIIEVNGDYWHNYEIFPESKIRDNALEKYVNENGFKIIWLWEYDIRKNPRQALENGFKNLRKEV